MQKSRVHWNASTIELLYFQLDRKMFDPAPGHHFTSKRLF